MVALHSDRMSAYTVPANQPPATACGWQTSVRFTGLENIAAAPERRRGARRARRKVALEGTCTSMKVYDLEVRL